MIWNLSVNGWGALFIIVILMLLALLFACFMLSVYLYKKFLKQYFDKKGKFFRVFFTSIYFILSMFLMVVIFSVILNLIF